MDWSSYNVRNNPKRLFLNNFLFHTLFSGLVSTPKRLHGGVKFVAEIPKNPSGKILRRVLREMVKKHKSKL